MSGTAVEKRLHEHGFSLKSVCWGYRDIFRGILEQLFEEEKLTEDSEITQRFFTFMNCADEQFFDHVLKEFLEAVSGNQKWLLDIPGIFEDIVNLGLRFTQEKFYYGLDFFRILKENGFGTNPRSVRNLGRFASYLLTIDSGLAHAFIQGYKTLSRRLRPDEIQIYLHYALSIFERSPEAALSFLKTESAVSETYIRTITQEARLEDESESMFRLIKALSGREIEIADLSGIDSDDLIELGSRFICGLRWTYVPADIRIFDDKQENTLRYYLLALVNAGMLEFKSFPLIHGHPRYSSSRDICSNPEMEVLFICGEYARVLHLSAVHWPGSRGLIDAALSAELDRKEHHPASDSLLSDLYSLMAAEHGRHFSPSSPAAAYAELLKQSVNCFSTLDLLQTLPQLSEQLGTEYPGLRNAGLNPVSFLPDFRFPLRPSSPPPDSLVADLKQEAEKTRGSDEENTRNDTAERHLAEETAGGNDDTEEQEENRESNGRAAYLYDEWNDREQAYHPNFCHVHEIYPSEHAGRSAPGEETEDAEIHAVKKLFELIKPEALTKEKYLKDGDSVNTDRLIDYLIRKKLEPEGKIDFYEKNRINSRDLAVLLLLDMSGSTNEEHSGRKVIDLEKHAALLLGQGLYSLGDRFSICGFSGSGRENCQYYIYKNFDDPWDRDARDRLQDGRPSNATRIGPALRHSACRLSRIEAKKKLIILLTDGKPMDQGYETADGYAQLDIRRACDENRKEGIETYCISTNENSRTDMEVMFTGKRFIILNSFESLPRILPRLFIKLTT